MWGRQTSYKTTDGRVHILLPLGSCAASPILLPPSLTSPFLPPQGPSSPPLPPTNTHTHNQEDHKFPLFARCLLGKSQWQMSWAKRLCYTSVGSAWGKGLGAAVSGCEETVPERRKFPSTPGGESPVPSLCLASVSGNLSHQLPLGLAQGWGRDKEDPSRAAGPTPVLTFITLHGNCLIISLGHLFGSGLSKRQLTCLVSELMSGF